MTDNHNNEATTHNSLYQIVKQQIVTMKRLLVATPTTGQENDDIYYYQSSNGSSTSLNDYCNSTDTCSTITWSCYNNSEFLKIAGAPISLPCIYRILGQLPHLQYLNLYLTNNDPDLNELEKSDYSSNLSFPSITTLCIKLCDAKSIDSQFWSLLFSKFSNLRRVIFEPKRFALDQMLKSLFPHIEFDITDF